MSSPFLQPKGAVSNITMTASPGVKARSLIQKIYLRLRRQVNEPSTVWPNAIRSAIGRPQWISISRGGSRGQFLFRGENPPRGALIHYYLGMEVKDATLEISDLEGKAVFSTKLEGKPGLSRFMWEFRFNPPELTAAERDLLDKLVKAPAGEERMRLSEELEKSLAGRGMRYTGFNARTGRLNDIAAEPGAYKVTLKAAGATQVKPLIVRGDPILK